MAVSGQTARGAVWPEARFFDRGRFAVLARVGAGWPPLGRPRVPDCALEPVPTLSIAPNCRQFCGMSILGHMRLRTMKMLQ